ncbi:hypothetical protein E3N88_23205 [Mikania micrantha]|uniref:Uncharacterized protein n=1 Tax=Mikania micrantha TaxID=192012 RepID=A0A5N6NCW0_9ASTR|nr:hypothetical protein E3N88_23205 [Mikania micrantha]
MLNTKNDFIPKEEDVHMENAWAFELIIACEAVECCTLDGESPVAESITSLRSDPSSMGHVESRVNQQGPPCKAKYSWVTDSEVVPLVDEVIQHAPWVMKQVFIDKHMIDYVLIHHEPCGCLFGAFGLQQGITSRVNFWSLCLYESHWYTGVDAVAGSENMENESVNHSIGPSQ